MKKTIIVILTALTLTFVGCSGGGAGNGNSGDPSGGGNYAKELWGEWIRMDTGDRWYISDEAVKINGSPAAVTAELTKESERVVAVKDGGRNYWLYAARAATASFTGVIVGDAGTGSARAMGGGLGGINVAVANLANQANRLTTTTDHEGVFVARGVIPGDSYLVTPESGKPVTVTPSGDGDDIGVVTVTSGVNFKTSIAPASASTDMNELYMNEWYGFDLTFENVGTEDCPAPSYAVTAPDGVTIGGDLQGILGTIEPDAKKSVRIDALCYAIDGDYQYKNISVTIKDATGKKWEDSVSLRFYRESITFNVRAERPTSGVVITPDAKTYSFTDTTDGSVTAPLRRTGDYLVVFSGATIDTETSYALGVGAAAAGDFGSFTDTSRYEPNNTEGAAAALGEPRIMAYLHKNDIDYYRVSYGNLGFLPAPTNATASVADAQVTLSWTGVAGAVSYNVYRSGSQTGT
ncbi:MAG: hypothetical protein LBE74_02435, partial [Treponema sp.]|nr:hypothetical protein [Treponema sp.]